MRRLCVFAGARTGNHPAFEQATVELGRLLADRGIGLVYGGGGVGLMGALADATLRHGGEAIGVIPTALVAREVAHRGLSELRTVESMHQRKAEMARLSDAFLALPGGLGTLDELMEACTWTQLRIHSKPCGLLNVAGYWDPLIAQLDRAADESFLRGERQDAVIVDTHPLSLLDRLQAWTAPPKEGEAVPQP